MTFITAEHFIEQHIHSDHCYLSVKDVLNDDIDTIYFPNVGVEGVGGGDHHYSIWKTARGHQAHHRRAYDTKWLDSDIFADVGASREDAFNWCVRHWDQHYFGV